MSAPAVKTEGWHAGVARISARVPTLPHDDSQMVMHAN